MTLVKTGTFTATVPVNNLPQVPAPVAGAAIINYSPFILTNIGRAEDGSSGLMVIHNIAVEPTDAFDNTVALGVGSVAIYRCTLAATFDGSPMNRATIVSLDSAIDIPTGITAYSGTVGGITARTIVSAVNISPSPFFASSVAGVSLYGPLGAFKQSPTFPSSGVDPLALANNEAIQIRKPQIGTTDAVLVVTILVRNALGQTFLVEGVSGYGSDILTIFNTTGDLLYVTDVTIADWYRATSVNQRYDITVSTANLRIDTPAFVVPYDSTKSIPNWVQCGNGYFIREGADMWIDYAEVLDVQIPVVAQVLPAASSARSNRPFITGRDTSKYLRAGKSLVFQLPANTVMSMGSHDIRVTFSTYAEEVTVSSGGEYSYAY